MSDSDSRHCSERRNFARSHRFSSPACGQKTLTEQEWETLETLYSSLSESDRAAVVQYGIPQLPEQIYTPPATTFIGNSINGQKALTWLGNTSAAHSDSYYFTYLDRIMHAPEWVTKMDAHRIINVHPAVLPYAAGMYAIEQIACKNNPKAFKKAAGATIHYVDAGVDTGDLIEVRPLENPFGFDSLWRLKAACRQSAFDLLVEISQQMERNPHFRPIGRPQNLSLCEYPAFTTKGFELLHGEADTHYAALKEEDLDITPSDDKKISKLGR